MTNDMKHTPEPWPESEGGTLMLPCVNGCTINLGGISAVFPVDYEYIRICVDACAGMALVCEQPSRCLMRSTLVKMISRSSEDMQNEREVRAFLTKYGE